jgi:hypothetical protein
MIVQQFQVLHTSKLRSVTQISEQQANNFLARDENKLIAAETERRQDYLPRNLIHDNKIKHGGVTSVWNALLRGISDIIRRKVVQAGNSNR